MKNSLYSLVQDRKEKIDAIFVKLATKVAMPYSDVKELINLQLDLDRGVDLKKHDEHDLIEFLWNKIIYFDNPEDFKELFYYANMSDEGVIPSTALYIYHLISYLVTRHYTKFCVLEELNEDELNLLERSNIPYATLKTEGELAYFILPTPDVITNPLFKELLGEASFNIFIQSAYFKESMDLILKFASEKNLDLEGSL